MIMVGLLLSVTAMPFARSVSQHPERARRRRGALAVATAALAAAVFVAGAVGPAAAVASAAPADGHDRGRLVAATHLRTQSPQEATDELAATGFATDTARYGADSYRLEYATVDVRNRPTTASGLLLLPRGGARELRTVVYEHGTASNRDDAPSMQHAGFVTSPALTYAAAGFAVVAPDYLGLGTGPGPHPWMDVPSETTASLDMLRAARAFLQGADAGHTMGRDVLVTGFSQGASAALGLSRALDDGAAPWFRLQAVAPVSGAYAFREVEIPALLGGELNPKSSTLYSAYLLVSWNRLHHLYDSPSEVFRSPYDAGIEQLFDGEHAGPELMAGTPDVPEALLTDKGMDLLRNPSDEFAAALHTADGLCTGWDPDVSLRLYAMPGDDEAATANTDRCAAELRASGAQPHVVEVPRSTHQGSAHLASNVLATAEIARWFSTFPQ